MPRIGGLYVDSSWFIYVLPALILASFAQMKVSNRYNRYSRVNSGTGVTVAQIARNILDNNGLNDIRIEQTSDKISDYYDPRIEVVGVSKSTYEGNSVA